MKRLVILFLFLLGSASYSQRFAGNQQHPRVAELQESMTRELNSFLRGRLPQSPFLVKIRILPLRRYSGQLRSPSSSRGTQQLPFYEVIEEEVVDEWDDPTKNDKELLQRVQRLEVDLALPSSLREDEVDEIKEASFAFLGLIPGRDEIKVESKDWDKKAIQWSQYTWEVVIFFLALGFTYIIVSVLAHKLIRAVSKGNENKRETIKVELPNQIPAGPSIANSHAKSTAPDKPLNNSGDINVSDPLRLKAVASKGLTDLCQNQQFPVLDDMIIFERLNKKGSAKLGAILAELKKEKLEEILGLSYSRDWIGAYLEPGGFDGDVMEAYYSLTRVNREDRRERVSERLILQVYRLKVKRTEFLKMLPPQEALAVLDMLPKSIALPEARVVFPGNWGSLLDPNFQPEKIPEKRMNEIFEIACQIKAIRKLEDIEKYRRDKELLDFLLTCNLEEERDVYQAISPDSFIHEIRPPFFKVLEADPRFFRQSRAHFSLTEWALATFNVRPDFRREFTRSLSPKEQMVLRDEYKSLEAVGIDPREQGEMRERIAKFYLGTQLGVIAGFDEGQYDEDEPDQESNAQKDEKDVA